MPEVSGSERRAREVRVPTLAWATVAPQTSARTRTKEERIVEDAIVSRLYILRLHLHFTQRAIPEGPQGVQFRGRAVPPHKNWHGNALLALVAPKKSVCVCVVVGDR